MSRPAATTVWALVAVAIGLVATILGTVAVATATGGLAGWRPDDYGALGQMIGAGGTIGVLMLAVPTAIYGKRQLDEIKAARDDQSETFREEHQPWVLVDIRSAPHRRKIFNLIIENIGRTIAKNVRFEFTPDLDTGRPDYPLANTALLREGLPHLAPDQRHEFFFASAIELFGSNAPLRYQVKITFDDRWGRSHSTETTIDLAMFKNVHYIEEFGIHDIAEDIKHLAAKVASVTSSGRLRVGVSTFK